jgi:hypothetical protein
MCVQDRTLTTESAGRERSIMAVHAAVSIMEGETFWWASLDGETWLPVNQPALPEHEQEIAQLFESDGNMKPLVFARRFLQGMDANFLNEEGTRKRRVAWEISQQVSA